MKALVAVYLTCLGVAALVFAIFPAEDTYINPIEIVPVERVIETRVETQAAPVEVNSQIVVELQSRVTMIETEDKARAADVDRRITNATDYAVQAVTQTDQLWKKVAAVEEVAATDRAVAHKVTYVMLGAFAAAWMLAAIALIRTLGSRRCNKTTSGTPTSAGTPTKR